MPDTAMSIAARAKRVLDTVGPRTQGERGEKTTACRSVKIGGMIYLSGTALSAVPYKKARENSRRANARPGDEYRRS